MQGSSISSDMVLLALCVLALGTLAIGAVPAWHRHRRGAFGPAPDPLEDLFKGDNLARAIAAHMAQHNQPAPHAMMAALRRVWREEAAAQATPAGLPSPSPVLERKSA